jgi:hypothetical protein
LRSAAHFLRDPLTDVHDGLSSVVKPAGETSLRAESVNCVTRMASTVGDLGDVVSGQVEFAERKAAGLVLILAQIREAEGQSVG